MFPLHICTMQGFSMFLAQPTVWRLAGQSIYSEGRLIEELKQAWEECSSEADRWVPTLHLKA